ncbi:MAG TPA: hypothetical protein VI384_04465 [Candidatus Dormibacteraeota bacterium]
MSNFIDLVDNGVPPPVAPSSTTRLTRIAGQLQASGDGGAYAPVALSPHVALPGTLALAGLAIPGLELWLDASDEASIVRAGTWPQVTTWKDKSGLGSRDVTATATPTLVDGVIGGRRAMKCNPGYFVNTTTNLGTGNAASPGVDRGARTTFIVAQSLDSIGGSLFSYRASVTNNCFVWSHLLSGGNIFMRTTGGADQHFITDVPAIQGVSNIWEFSYDGSFAVTAANSMPRLRLNGLAKDSNGGTFTTAETGTTGFVIGNFLVNSTLWNGYIAEVLCFNRELSPAEARAVRAYLAAKYSIGVAGPQKVVMALGDSLFFGQGNANTLASGGMRKELQSLHANLLFFAGRWYQPVGTLTGLPPVIGTQAGQFNACEGTVGWTSENNPARGIGGAYLVATMTATPADVVLLMIGINDNVVAGLTAAQSRDNILAIIDAIGSMMPTAQVVVIRPPLLRTDNANAGTANPIIAQIGPLLEAALVASPRANVLRHPATGANVIIPSVIPDALYADTTHPDVTGWHFFLMPGGTTNGGFDAELRARGL